MSFANVLDQEVESLAREAGTAGRAMTGPLTRFNAFVARCCMYFAVAGLLLIVLTVAWQVFGRYVLNNPPTWAEGLALLLILYVTLLAAAVGVRDAGHIGMESLLVLAPERVRIQVERLIHVLVASFGAAMVWNGCLLGMSVMNYKIPGLGVSEGLRYVPLVLSGALIVLFSLEHVIASLRNLEVEPAWH